MNAYELGVIKFLHLKLLTVMKICDITFMIGELIINEIIMLFLWVKKNIF